MKRVYFLFSFFLILSYFSTFSYTQAYVFSQNLKLGDRGQDVLELQKLLNSSPDTQIALSGSGSPGQETTTFGMLTQKAVVKLQNKYKSEILTPSGLLWGTGYVGVATRNKLNVISSPTSADSSSFSSNTTPLLSTTYKVSDSEKIDIYTTDKKIQAIRDDAAKMVNESVITKQKPDTSNLAQPSLSSIGTTFIYRLSSQIVVPGTKVTIIGYGFTASNNVYIGSDYIIRDVKANGTGITFTMPAVPYDKYDLVVQNYLGISNSKHIIVAPNTQNNLKISAITPQTAHYGDSITIIGTGFGPKNDVITTFGTIKDVPSSDGKTITLTLKPDLFTEISKLGSQNKKFPAMVDVISNEGYTTSPSIFTFTY